MWGRLDKVAGICFICPLADIAATTRHNLCTLGIFLVLNDNCKSDNDFFVPVLGHLKLLLRQFKWVLDRVKSIKSHS